MAGISEASGQDVGKMMDNWLSKTGFPLITVEETEKGLKVRQNRFFATADATVSIPFPTSSSRSRYEKC
jgi:aminopeptidase 2